MRKANAGKPKVRVFYQIWKTPLMTVGGPQIISDAITLCGGENVFGQLGKMAPTVSVEAVLEADPKPLSPPAWATPSRNG
jgi:iron complex transport system substrate-binding protein